MPLGGRLLHPRERRPGIGGAALAGRQKLSQAKLRNRVAQRRGLAQPLPGPAPIHRRQPRTVRHPQQAQRRQVIRPGRRLEVGQPLRPTGQQQRPTTPEAEIPIVRLGRQGLGASHRQGPVVQPPESPRGGIESGRRRGLGIGAQAPLRRPGTGFAAGQQQGGNEKQGKAGGIQRGVHWVP